MTDDVLTKRLNAIERTLSLLLFALRSLGILKAAGFSLPATPVEQASGKAKSE